MELKDLIAKSHELREQLKRLQSQESDVKSKLETYESQIKSKLDNFGEEYADLTEDEFQLMMAELGDPMNLTVEIVYATKDTQTINEIQLARGASIEDGIIMSGILDKCPDINLSTNKVGIHGVVKSLSTTVSNGDRIEIYRPVTAETNK